jgi:hypothetical protein
VLEGRFTQTVETQPELLAHHSTEAGLPEKGISYWLKAGRRSRTRSAASRLRASGRVGCEKRRACLTSLSRETLVYSRSITASSFPFRTAFTTAS